VAERTPGMRSVRTRRPDGRTLRRIGVESPADAT
jgi:hypothetical protein